MSRLALLLLVPLSAFGWAWSSSTGHPDSERLATQTAAPIAFLRGEKARDLVVVNPDGSNERTVVRMPRGYSISAYAWAPSGRRIAFEATTPLGKERLYVFGANGRGLRRLAQWEDYASVVAWSPRGRKILFDKQNDGAHQFWVVNADGWGARKLTPIGWFGGATWSLDGRRIAFFGRAGKRQVTGIHMMSANGQIPRANPRRR